MSTPIFAATLAEWAADGDAAAALRILDGVDRAACEAAISRRRKLEYRFPPRLTTDDHVTALDRIDHLYGSPIVKPTGPVILRNVESGETIHAGPGALFSVFPPDPPLLPWSGPDLWKAGLEAKAVAPKEPNVFDRAKRRTVDFAREIWEIDFISYAPGALLGMLVAAGFIIFFSEVR
jgi:hypothetical protein